MIDVYNTTVSYGVHRPVDMRNSVQLGRAIHPDLVQIWPKLSLKLSLFCAHGRQELERNSPHLL